MLTQNQFLFLSGRFARLSGRLVAIAGYFVAASALALFSPTVTRATPIGVDLRDVAQFDLASFPAATLILETFNKNPEIFVPAGVSFLLDGPGQPNFVAKRLQIAGKKTLANTVYGVELAEQPTSNADGTSRVLLNVLYHLSGTNFFYRQLELTLNSELTKIQNVTVTKNDFSLNKMHFSMEVSLAERKAILSDTTTGIKKVYPLGVGGFDEGITPESGGRVRLMSVPKVNAKLMRSKATAYKLPVEEYLKLPYMPITKSNGLTIPVAFHIVQHSNESPRGQIPGTPRKPLGRDMNYMIRGFDSHACYRLREKDLYELYAILMHQEKDAIDLNVSFQLGQPGQAEPELEHPMPKRNDGYKTVTNYGTAEHPKPKRDPKYHYYIMSDVLAPPPIEQLGQVAGSSNLH